MKLGGNKGPQLNSKFEFWVRVSGGPLVLNNCMSPKMSQNKDLSLVDCELLTKHQVFFILNIQRLKCDAAEYKQTSMFLEPG